MKRQGFRIVTLSLISVIPVFVLLSVGFSALFAYLAHRETVWGLEEEARSTVIAAAEMTHIPVFRRFVHSPLSLDSTNRAFFLAPYREVLNRERVFRLFAVLPGGKVPLDLTKDTLSAPLPKVDWKDVDSQQVVIRMDMDARGGRRLLAAAMVRDTTKAPLALLAIQTDAGAIQDILDRSLASAIRRTLVSLLVGALCALFIARTLKRRIAVLRHAIQHVGREQHDATLANNLGIIRETNDLGTSLQTMMSVLWNTVMNARGQFTGIHEQVHDEAMIEALMLPDEAASQTQVGNLWAGMRSVGEDRKRCFAGSVVREKQISLYFGRMPTPMTMENAVLGSSLRRYLEVRLPQHPVKKVLVNAISMFPAEDLTVVQWNADQPNDVQQYRTFAGKGVRTSTDTVPNNTSKAFHNLGDDADQRLILYSKEFCDCEPQNLLDELSRFAQQLPSLQSGSIVLLYLKNFDTTTPINGKEST